MTARKPQNNRLELAVNRLLRTLFVATTLSFSALICSFSALSETLELYWEDMAPKDYVMPENPMVDHNNPMAQMNPKAPIIKELDGKDVKIPGFVVPLEGDEETLTEFLLVPYFGACVHVPPPPSNQIVYVKFEKGVPVESLYDAVWVHGKLSTKSWEGEIASVGYRLTGVKIEPFE